jgi:dTDP-4-amino-4,6-dideoxygalactose transaminase
MMRLEEKGIATRQGTHAPVIQGYYVEKYRLRPEQFPNAYLADRLSLTLPLYVQLTEAEQVLVVNELKRTFEEQDAQCVV